MLQKDQEPSATEVQTQTDLFNPDPTAFHFLTDDVTGSQNVRSAQIPFPDVFRYLLCFQKVGN